MSQAPALPTASCPSATVTQNDVETQLTPGLGYPVVPGPGAPPIAAKVPTPLTEHCPAGVHEAKPGLSDAPLVPSVQVATPPAGSVDRRGSPPTTAATQKAEVGHEIPVTLYCPLCWAKEG